MRIVVDTNVIFSALINSNSTIPEIILAPYSRFKFYTPEFLFEELDNHK
jgi:predicted nucleic acid-binding protein